MAENLDSLLEAVNKRGEQTLGVLERWVRQNSYSAEVANVDRVGEMLVEDFTSDELRFERFSGDGVGDHLLWRSRSWESAPKERRVLLVGHHDTVFPPGSFELWKLGGGKLQGPGVLDMKGGISVIWTALRALEDVGLLAKLAVGLISVSDEEIGSPHSHELTAQIAADAGCALVFEGGRAEDRIITQRKGTGAIKIRAKGVAAHAGNHHADGVNAIRGIARFIDRVEKLTDYEAGTTVNVGLVEGGEARNTVPHHATCDIDFRFTVQERGTRLVAQVAELVGAVSATTGVELLMEGGIRRPPLARTDASAKLYEEYATCAKAAGLGDAENPLIGGGSDANNIAAVGTPAIDGLGPRGRGFHTHDEFIEVDTLLPKSEALARFLAGRCG